jgi:hypothetical protein
MDADNGGSSFVTEHNRDTIPFRYRAGGAACRPGVSISHGRANLYLRISACICVNPCKKKLGSDTITVVAIP